MFWFGDMTKQIRTVTRERPALARFGGRTWELVEVKYGSAKLRSEYAEAVVAAYRVEPLNKLAEDMLHG